MTTRLGRPTNITAAAIPLRRRDLRSPTQSRKLLQDSGDDRYWSYWRNVPAISNYVQVLSNSADLVSYYPGLLDSEASEPVQVTDGPAFAVWESFGGEAVMSEWVSSLVTHESVPGQGWFVPLIKPDVLAQVETVGPVDPDAESPEVTWQVVSTADLRRLLKLDPSQGIPDDDNRIWRIYDPDPQNSKEPTSAVRRVATQAQILMLIDRRTEADLHSRIHAGIWPLPASLKSITTPSGKTWADVLEEGLISAAQPGALEALIPLIAFVDNNDELPLIKPPIRLTFDDGERLVKLKEETLKDLATGLDAPQELTTGMNTLNHWGAWLIQEETYTQHLDPLIVRILRSLNPWWQAQLEAARVPNPEDYVLWRNPATAINRPNSFTEAKDLHDRFVISDDALRSAADKSEADAPDDAEIVRRIEIQRALKAPTTQATVDETRTIPDTDPLQAAADDSFAEEAASAAGLERLARRLTQIDASTLQRLELEAAKQLRRKRQSLLDRIESAAKKRGIEVGDPDTLPMRLGPTQVQELIPGNLTEPDDFDPAPFRSILQQAQEETRSATQAFGIPRDGEADSDDRSDAVTLLLAALAGSLANSLFRTPDISGELGIDGAEWVPTDSLRKAMDTAGGGTARRFGDDAYELIGNGKRTVDGMTSFGIQTSAFQWNYGSMPRKNFEPHLNLDGFTFERWDDPALEQPLGASWLSGQYLFPGDHRGCSCAFSRILTMIPAMV